MLPPTVTTVCERAFKDKKELKSVRFNDELKTLEKCSFEGTGVRRLTLPFSINYVQSSAFGWCEHLQLADFRAARELTRLGDMVF